MKTSFLKKLDLHKNNEGTWTGQKSLKSYTFIESLSPVDGELIGSVSMTPKKDYEKEKGGGRDSGSYS
jgi:aldehyde dehydrogenase (NAD+)